MSLLFMKLNLLKFFVCDKCIYVFLKLLFYLKNIFLNLLRHKYLPNFFPLPWLFTAPSDQRDAYRQPILGNASKLEPQGRFIPSILPARLFVTSYNESVK